MRVAKRGPEPATAKERSVRPVAYRPALSEESAAVRTTTWITLPACGTPIPLKKVTKGDSSVEYAVYGRTTAMSATAPT